MTPAHAYISLGANLGDRDSSIASSLQLLGESDGVDVLDVAPTINSPALTKPASSPQPDYRNTAAHLQTTLKPRDLLNQMLDVERTLGRTRSEGLRWEPRTIDIDLLLYDGLILDEDGLTIPHPQMHTRGFVLEPLAQIAPEATHPVLNRTIQQLLASLRNSAAVAISLVMLLLSSTTLAQDASLDILERAHSQLREQPIGLEVGFNLRTDGGLESQTITIISEPGQTYLDLNSIRVLVTDNECTIQNPESGRWITLSDSQSTGMQLLASALPPIPLFVLDLLSSDDPQSIESALLGTITWSVPDLRDATIALDGVGELDTTITLVVDAESATPLSATTRLSTPQGTRTIIENYTLIDHKPVPELTQGKRVESIMHLVPTPGSISVGDKLPQMLLFRHDATADFSQPGTPTALLFTRDAPPRHLLDSLATLTESSEFEARLVAVIDNANPISMLASLDPALHDSIRWSADAASTIDKFAPDADAVLVVSDEAGTIRLVQVVEDQSLDSAEMLTRITDALASD